MGMPPMNQLQPGGMGGGAPAGGGMDFAASLQELQQSLPPEQQAKLDPRNAITQLLFKRLRDGISEEEGQALLMLFGNADAMALSAMKKFLPEIIVLLDIFDDGELNDSVGTMDAGSGDMGAPAPGGPGPVPRSTAPRPGPAAQQPGYEQDDDEDDDAGAGAMARLSQVRA